jgi:hypothetical protein
MQQNVSPARKSMPARFSPWVCLLVALSCSPDGGDTNRADPQDSRPPLDTMDSTPLDDTGPPDDTGSSPHPTAVQRGDIVLWGRPLAEPGEDGFEEQILAMYSEYAAEFAQVTTPFWGELDSWNGHREPLGADLYWERIELIDATGEVVAEGGRQPLVLRPSEAWLAELDTDAMLSRAEEPIGRYNQPVIGLTVRWFQAEDNPLWWLFDDGGHEKWADLYGVNLAELPSPVAMQYNPHQGSEEVTDIEQESFWDRDADEASHAAWAILWGWYRGSNTGLRDQLMANPAAVAAVDAVSIGQLGWWLDDQGLVEVIGRQPTAALSVRHEAKDWWASATWATLPLTLDLRAEAEGISGSATLRVYCDAGGEPVHEQALSLPGSVELSAPCSYLQADRYHPYIELLQDGEVVVEAQTTVAVVPPTLPLQRGDFTLWGYPVLEQSDLRYEDEMFKGFFGLAASNAGVYDPYWGGPLGTFDGASQPMGERYMWGHIEVVTEDGDFTLMEDTVVLRPTEAMRALVDLGAMAERAKQPEYGYARPYMGNLIEWVHWGAGEIDWMASQDELLERWAATYGLDFAAIPNPQAVQWSAVYLEEAHTDITAEAFWERDANCSSRAAWNMVWGAYAMQGEPVREQLLGAWETVAAIDSITPGQLAWWLVDSGMAEVVGIASDPDFVPASAR